jgi:protein O-GlcNAcase/histone acetyltransferase
MAMDADFLAGVIEGFYGQPWSQGERFQLFEWMKAWGLNTYFYAPKDDLKHRSLWRELYTEEEAEELKAVITECARNGLRFIYGIAPGLDIRYADDWEVTVLKVRLEQMQRLGCRDFAILFDDIPDRMSSEDAKRFGSFAKAQCHIANTALGFLPAESRVLFCPTPYCGRMAAAKLGGENYLATIGKGLSAKIDIFWTGPDIISREITVEHVREMQGVLRRKPVIWDNLHANDYDGRRFFCGPYSGRPSELKDEVAGILSNPNCEFALNYVPVQTLATYLRGPVENARGLYGNAMREWAARFETVHGPLAFGDLVLFCDCFYLPYEDGGEAERLFGKIREALAKGKEVPDVGRLRAICAKLAELKDRPLFYALSKRAWELREEMDLIEKLLAGAKGSDFHLPGTYRGGFVARLQTLLKQKDDGTFET